MSGMQEYRCRYCGYYLFSTDAERGRIRAICRQCRRPQVIELRPAPAPEPLTTAA